MMDHPIPGAQAAAPSRDSRSRSADPHTGQPHVPQLSQKVVDRLNQMGLVLLAAAETVRKTGSVDGVSEGLEDMADRLTMLEIAVAAIGDGNPSLAADVLEQLGSPNRPLM